MSPPKHEHCSASTPVGGQRHVRHPRRPRGRARRPSRRRRPHRPGHRTRRRHPLGRRGAGATSRRADLTDPGQAADAVAGAEVVFQCAQPPYHRWPEEFPALQARAVDAADIGRRAPRRRREPVRLRPVAGPLTEDLPLTATTRKGAVRAQMWHDLQAAHAAGRLRVVAARASDFFGPGVEASAVGHRFFGPLARGKAVRVIGDPDRLHTYTYVPDFGEAMVRLSETPEAWGRAWHVPNAPDGHDPGLRRAGRRLRRDAARPPPGRPAGSSGWSACSCRRPRDGRDALRVRARTSWSTTRPTRPSWATTPRRSTRPWRPRSRRHQPERHAERT